MIRQISTFCVLVAILLTMPGCTSSLHGSYAPISYVSDDVIQTSEALGRVQGMSCQTKFLYVFPVGEGVSTSAAIRRAKEDREGTRYIADISIDDRMNWQVGYLEQCITVEAIAY